VEIGTPVLENPDTLIEDDKKTDIALPWNVILYNDDYHTFNEVILQIQKATGVSIEVAFELTMQVHTQGQANCYEGTHTECERVAAVLREIRLSVEVTQGL
jgi:ATP-dependent Clp protease adaptor protein ClpS